LGTHRSPTAFQNLAIAILRLLNQPTSRTDKIWDILLLIKDFAGVEAAAIRLKEGDDYPYYQVSGFPEEFVEAETYLCQRDPDGHPVQDEDGTPCLDCMCGNVIQGRTDPELPFFTQAGSFWTNSTTALLAGMDEGQLQGRTRNRCNAEGYESVALIPLAAYDMTIGLLQLNDSRRDCFTPELVHFLEGIGVSIGIVLAAKQAEEEREKLIWQLQQSLEEVKTLTGLLPICSYCKKVRDDSGYWNEVELYLCERTDANFTHGVCPDCYENTVAPQIEELTHRCEHAKGPPSDPTGPVPSPN